MKKKVLITQPWPISFVKNFDSFVKKLEDRGYEVILDPKTNSLTEDDVIERAPGIYAHICGADTWSAKALSYADELKIIARIGVGYDTIDIPEATKRGVAVMITPGAGAETVAEHAFGMLLAVGRQLLKCDKLVREGKWQRTNGYSLYRKNLGILGFGAIGKQLAKISKGFDMNILAYDLYPDEKYAKENGITYVSFEDLLKNADFISLHLPKTPETVNIISTEEFKMMKPSAIIVNTSRGGIIDENALYTALKEGEIFGAGIDVFVEEPVNPKHKLFELDNIIVSAHNAGTSVEGKYNLVKAAINNFLDFEEGKRPIGLKNPEIFG